MTEPDALLDTSAAIPLVVTGHEAHDTTLRALHGQRLGLAGHAWFETFSVLTRLPSPARRGPAEVVSLLRHNFPESRFLDRAQTEQLTHQLAEDGPAGGAVYDALVAMVAADAGLPLISRDRRAERTYTILGAHVRFLP